MATIHSKTRQQARKQASVEGALSGKPNIPPITRTPLNCHHSSSPSNAHPRPPTISLLSTDSLLMEFVRNIVTTIIYLFVPFIMLNGILWLAHPGMEDLA